MRKIDILLEIKKERETMENYNVHTAAAAAVTLVYYMNNVTNILFLKKPTQLLLLLCMLKIKLHTK